MLKNIFLTMIMDKKAMKEVNTYKNSFFIVFTVIVFILESIFGFLRLQVADNSSLSTVQFIGVMLAREVSFILLGFLLGYILYQTFLRKENVKIPDLVFKMIFSMNFISLIAGTINMYFNLGISLVLLRIVYDFFFITNYIQVNLELELSEKTLRKYVLVAFILTCILFFFIFKIIVLIIGAILRG